MVDMYLREVEELEYDTFDQIDDYLGEYRTEEEWKKREDVIREFDVLPETRDGNGRLLSDYKLVSSNQVIEEIECTERNELLDIPVISPVIGGRYSLELEGETVSRGLKGFKLNKLKMVGKSVIPTHYAPKVDGYRALIRISKLEPLMYIHFDTGFVTQCKCVANVTAILEVEVVQIGQIPQIIVLDVVEWDGVPVYMLPMSRRIQLMTKIAIFAACPIYYQKYTSVDKMWKNTCYYRSKGIQVDGVICVDVKKSYMLSTSKWKRAETVECLIRVDINGCRAVIRDESMTEDKIVGYVDNTTYRYRQGDICEFDISGEKLVYVRHRSDRRNSNSKVVYEDILVFNVESRSVFKHYGLGSSLNMSLCQPDEDYNKYVRRKINIGT